MPPKKAAKKTAAATAKDEAKAHDQAGKDAAAAEDVKEEIAQNGEKEQKSTKQSAPSKKRKKLLNYLLSKECDELLRPDDEAEDVQKRGNIKTYSSSTLSVFEELICAVILSRPISHRLGQRTIRTILNDPYNFNTAKAIKDAGTDKTHKAMWDARTQHKEKTASQLSAVADLVLENENVSKVLSDKDVDPDEALEMLKKEIKGFGETSSKILLRRVQWIWSKAFPFVDNVSWKGLKALGLPEEAEPLNKFLGEHWKSLDTKHLKVDGGEEAKKRRAFVVLVERATSCELENKTNELLAAAADSK
ncbi:hypothetical protein HII31_07317 [Pseudocercospora fuligena]|uniref:HhH-GPD domain-containing protein n=1 Tax=Pseudocercospora fuligena TaxID=685502 RepID=A0A8H6VKE6_9PEZI|nr:hypothetical protein HII31_07317 [Pseudocercospora fuligena]